MTVTEFIRENVDFEVQYFHYILDLPNGNSISIMRIPHSFGAEDGLMEAAVMGDNVNKFFECLFGWLTVDDVIFLAEMTDIADTDDFCISEEFYGLHLISEEALKENELLIMQSLHEMGEKL